MSAEGEVERKVRELREEIFHKYNPGNATVNDEGKPYISKENLREFIMEIMEQAGENDAWDEDDFEQGYYIFDKDRSGQIDHQEFDDFVKRFADLWTKSSRREKQRQEASLNAS